MRYNRPETSCQSKTQQLRRSIRSHVWQHDTHTHEQNNTSSERRSECMCARLYQLLFTTHFTSVKHWLSCDYYHWDIFHFLFNVLNSLSQTFSVWSLFHSVITSLMDSGKLLATLCSLLNVCNMRVSVDQKPYLGSAAGLRDVRRDKRDGVSAGDEFTPLINTHIHTHTQTRDCGSAPNPSEMLLWILKQHSNKNSTS